MDNITHSLAGLVVGEIASDRSKATQEERALLLTSSVLANNFPDIDLLYTRISPDPIGYLLHHRGHTHTLGGLILQLFIILGILFLFPGFRKLLKQKKAKILTTVTVALGLCTHLFLDGWNSYGVHPFWPFSSRWFYGDAIFIIEPVLWVSLSLPLFFTFKSQIFRGLLLAFISLVPIWAWSQNILLGYSILGLGVLAATLFFILRKIPQTKWRLVCGLIAALLFVEIQFTVSHAVKNQLISSFVANSDQHRIIDIVANPQPANPLCWNVIQLEIDGAQKIYRGTIKPFSVFPKILPAESCPAFRSDEMSFDLPLSEFKTAIEQDCFFTSWLQFARAPILAPQRASDLRFGSEGNFSELINVGINRDCPAFVTRWEKPRQDLLNELGY